MFLETRFERLIDRVRAQTAIPLRLELWNGHKFDLAPCPVVTIAIPTPSALRYFIPPDLNKLGEAFVEGHIRVEGPIEEIFRVSESLARSVAATTRAGFHYVTRHSRQRDRKAVEYHYDVSNDFYALFLDRNMVYSCAYYRNDRDTLDAAQEQKLDHILAKLMLKPGERIQSAGMQRRCRVELCDFRDLASFGKFDKIASVGMFEHVGLKNLHAYFGTIESALADEGLVLNHGITSSNADSSWMGLGAGEFVDRYVFPDGELPHVSLVLQEMARAGLEVTDVESLRRHYARTCHEWTIRLESRRDRAAAIAGDRRLRIWQIYLAGCAYGFANGWMNIYQALACKTKNTLAAPLPLTRDYLYSS